MRTVFCGGLLALAIVGCNQTPRTGDPCTVGPEANICEGRSGPTIWACIDGGYERLDCDDVCAIQCASTWTGDCSSDDVGNDYCWCESC